MLINVVHGHKDTAIILTKWSTDRFRLLFIVDQSNAWKFVIIFSNFFFLSCIHLVPKLLCFVHHIFAELFRIQHATTKTASN